MPKVSLSCYETVQVQREHVHSGVPWRSELAIFGGQRLLRKAPVIQAINGSPWRDCGKVPDWPCVSASWRRSLLNENGPRNGMTLKHDKRSNQNTSTMPELGRWSSAAAPHGRETKSITQRRGEEPQKKKKKKPSSNPTPPIGLLNF